jgi:hypothetical protein
MIRVLQEENLVERFTDDPVSGGVRIRVEGRWRGAEKEVKHLEKTTWHNYLIRQSNETQDIVQMQSEASLFNIKPASAPLHLVTTGLQLSFSLSLSLALSLSLSLSLSVSLSKMGESKMIILFFYFRTFTG